MDVLNTLDEKAWQDFLSEFNQKVERKVKLDGFKEDLWDSVVGFGEAVLIATGIDEKARGELLEKVRLREQKQSTEPKSCKDNSTTNEKTENKEIRI